MVKISKKSTKKSKEINDKTEIVKIPQNHNKNPIGISKMFEGKIQQDPKREIVVELFNSDERLDEKTELDNPIRWACLHSMQQYIENLNMKYSALILEKFINKTMKFLISKNRKGRDEYIQALKSLANLDEQPKKKENSLMIQ